MHYYHNLKGQHADLEVDPTADHCYSFRSACKNGHLEVVRELIQDKRCDPSIQDNYSIRFAAAAGHVEIVELLLSQEGVDPSAIQNEAFQNACRRGRDNVVKLFLEDKRIDPAAQDSIALYRSAKDGHLSIVKQLLNDGRVNVNSSHNSQSPLHAACKREHFPVALLLIDHRADIYSLDFEMKRPLDRCSVLMRLKLLFHLKWEVLRLIWIGNTDQYSLLSILPSEIIHQIIYQVLSLEY